MHRCSLHARAGLARALISPPPAPCSAQPCNQFGGQEPGSNGEVKAFAARQGASFPLLAKGDVNGAKEEPLWTYLKANKGGLLGSDLKWNFTKFLLDREGRVVQRYGSTTSPSDIEKDIVALL